MSYAAVEQVVFAFCGVFTTLSEQNALYKNDKNRLQFLISSQ